MKEHDLKELFKKAAEIAKAVPEALQEAAFNRAIDALMGQNSELGALGRENTRGKTGHKPPPISQSRQVPPEDTTDPTARLLQSLDRTAYPQVLSSPRVLERSLCLLRAARDDFKIDGLGCAAIAKILTEKFRLRTTRQAVQQALDVAGDKVDRVTPPGGKTYYRIMHPGERYLDSPDSKNPQRKASVRQHGAPAKQKSRTDIAKKPASSASSMRATAKKGLKTILLSLVEDGYFDEPKRIGEVRDYLQHRKGHDIKITTLSPYFTRMLRNNVLDRTRATDGQYEYKRK